MLYVVLLEALCLVSEEDEGDENQVMSCCFKLRAYKTRRHVCYFIHMNSLIRKREAVNLFNYLCDKGG